VRCGEPVAEILAATTEAEADLIILTSHGRSGFGRLLFGSVAEAVLRRADVPVFLMRQTAAQVAARTVWQPLR
jgi:nucleotide-binding universal stress UspA family protein